MDYKNSYEVPTFNETNLKIGYTLNMSGTKVAAIVHANNIFNHEHFAQGSIFTDYGYDFAKHNSVAQAPLANYWLTVKVSL